MDGLYFFFVFWLILIPDDRFQQHRSSLTCIRSGFITCTHITFGWKTSFANPESLSTSCSLSVDRCREWRLSKEVSFSIGFLWHIAARCCLCYLAWAVLLQRFFLGTKWCMLQLQLSKNSQHRSNQNPGFRTSPIGLYITYYRILEYLIAIFCHIFIAKWFKIASY